MSREILMATTNHFKTERFKNYLSPLGLAVVNFRDIGFDEEILEDGRTPEENALKKARAGFEFTGFPTFGVDLWLRNDGLSEELQPGPHVRRIFVEGEERKAATDEEMLEYYIELIEKLGGTANGLWTSAIGLVVAPGHEFAERYTRKTIFTSKMNLKKTRGEPLNSLQIDPETGKYLTDFTKEEWVKYHEGKERYADFIRGHLEEII